MNRFPILLIAIITFVIGMTTSSVFAEETWYLGKGLKSGDFFRYSLCEVEYKECTQFELGFWVKGKTEKGDWDLQMVASEGNKIVNGNMQVSQVTFEPIGFSDEINPYAKVYRNSLAWLSGFATKDDPISLTNTLSCYYCSMFGNHTYKIVGEEKITVIAGTFNVWLFGWHRASDNKIWIEPHMPFPIKAHTFVDVSSETIPVAYKFELLEYGNSFEPPNFLVNHKTKSFAFGDAEWKTYQLGANFTRPNKEMVHQVFKIPYNIINGTLESMKAEFGNLLVTIKSENDGLFEISAPRKLIDTTTRSQDDATFFVMADGRQIEYTELQKTDCFRILSIPFTRGTEEIEIIESFAGNELDPSLVPVHCDYSPPRQQSANGVAPEGVICKEGLQLIFKSKDNSPACVKSTTAAKLGQRGWATKISVINNKPKTPENPTLVMSDELLKKGEIIKANFTIPANKEIYVDVKCFEPTGWNLLKLNDTQSWIDVPPWKDNVSICSPHCENNTLGGVGCDGLCPREALGCKRFDDLSDIYSSFSWDGKFREPRTGFCGTEHGSFVFVDPASAGQYKLQYQYFEDNECIMPKFAEKTFVIN